MANNDVNKLLGLLWKELPKDKREIYEQQSLFDKVRYFQEMQEYEPSEGFGRQLPRIRRPESISAFRIDAGFDSSEAAAYKYFLEQELHQLSRYGFTMANAMQSRGIKERWIRMVSDEKKLYQDMAEAHGQVVQLSNKSK